MIQANDVSTYFSVRCVAIAAAACLFICLLIFACWLGWYLRMGAIEISRWNEIKREKSTIPKKDEKKSQKR